PHDITYKNQCVKDWKGGQSIQLRHQYEVFNLDLSTLSIKMNYDFRIRMKLGCLDKDWSKWTKVQSACMVEASAYIWVYILIIVLPLTAFLVCFLSINQHFIPDPRHFKNKIMDTAQSQLSGGENLTQWNEECSTTDIEIIDKNPMYTSPEQHDSMYCIYFSETPGEITELQYSRSLLGYIISMKPYQSQQGTHSSQHHSTLLREDVR
uniref:Uncharacterized protein n=1 Tax=Cyprinus carpio TaxID=7962 RepID=A0A8C2A7T4_CYPCA